jgi:hypothetical protein
MLRIDAAELRIEEARLGLQAVRERDRGHERLLELELGFPLGIEEVQEVHLRREVGIHCPHGGEFQGLQRETALPGVMLATLELLDLGILLSRRPNGDHEVKGEIDQPQRRRADLLGP